VQPADHQIPRGSEVPPASGGPAVASSLAAEPRRLLMAGPAAPTSPPPIPLEATGAAEPPLPRRLGKYELLRRLAVGGMAEIYLARATGIEGFEKIVVVKRILPELGLKQELVRMFLGEARLAATLHHPNVVQVYDVGAADGSFFFAMEHVHGQDLRAVIEAGLAQKRHVPFAEAISIGVGMCAGLHYAHESVGFDGRPLGIIHRDVSLSNVLVSYDGCTKVVDFGIAKANTSTVQTQHGTVRGKVSYLSPEQCRCEPLDRRSDVFAIGIVLWELTTSRRLFRRESDFATMRAITEGSTIPPSQRRPGYPPELEAIVMKALARRPEDRYQTAQELQLDLEAFAREQRLVISSVSLARFMEGLFADKIAAWREAQQAGKALGEHLAATASGASSEHGRDLASPPSPLPSGVIASPPPAGGATKPDIPAAEIARRRVRAAAAGRRAAIGRRREVVIGALAGAVALAAVMVWRHGTGRSDAPPHPAEAVAPGGSEPRGAAVVVDGGRPPATMPAERGALDVRTNAPAAAWKLDGVPAPDQGGCLRVEVAPGRHTVTVEAKGFKALTEVIVVPAQGTALRSFTLKPDPGRRADRARGGARRVPSDPNGIDGWPLQ
jgi:serine/threonine protein kinase